MIVDAIQKTDAATTCYIDSAVVRAECFEGKEIVCYRPVPICEQ